MSWTTLRHAVHGRGPKQALTLPARIPGAEKAMESGHPDDPSTGP